MSKFNVGDKVRFIGKSDDYILNYGDVGTVVYVIQSKENIYVVNWNCGSFQYSSVCNENNIELVIDMTNKEIWEMLKPKMEKNGLNGIHMGRIPCSSYLDFNLIKWYKEDDVHNAIAIAYRSGYERAIKGRPFKIGQKKKKGGHWEPVDPKNLPKEGTKVRYSRECKDYSSNDEYICINDTGIVKLEGSWFGVTLDNPHRYKWICFDEAEDCLDMWVEDDE